MSFWPLLKFFFFRTEDEEQGDAEHSAVNVESHREENVNRQIQVRNHFYQPTLNFPRCINLRYTYFLI